MNKISKLIFFIPCLSIIGCSSEETVSKKQYDYMRDHIISMWAETLKDAGYKVAFYGDSRIAGGDFQNEFKEFKAVNLGIGGDRVEDLVDRFKLIEACQPEITFVEIGGNNVLAGNYNYVDSFEQLMQKFEAVDTKVVLHKTPGISQIHIKDKEELKKKNLQMSELNARIETIADKYNADILDLASLLNDENGALKDEYTTDGVHFNREGNQVWYTAVREYLTGFYKNN